MAFERLKYKSFKDNISSSDDRKYLRNGNDRHDKLSLYLYLPREIFAWKDNISLCKKEKECSLSTRRLEKFLEILWKSVSATESLQK